MNNDTIIISMTSYPKRINCVYDAYISIIKQINNNNCHCVLVLAECEFKNKENDLPSNLLKLIYDKKIELIWCEKNIFSHKKLMPTLKKYPNNPILIVDDDIKRPFGWLDTFISDHNKFPNDIICGLFQWHFSENLKLKRFENIKGKNSGTQNNVDSIIFNFARPANGCGGVLYPAHTFCDNRFFDENLYMKYSPKSDESWQFMFNIIENRTLRMLSKVYDYSEGFITGTQKMDTCLYKQNNYEKINEILFEHFKDYKTSLINRTNDLIVSVTSYKERIKNLKDVLTSILENTMKPWKVVVTLTKEDSNYVTNELTDFFKKNNIELILCDYDIKPHKKYYYVMKKYKNHPIITIDDDIIYTEDLIKSLYDSYLQYPNSVIARRTHIIMYDDLNNAKPYKTWIKEQKTIVNPSYDIMATGVGGILYPPNILDIDNISLSDINKCINADDILLKYIENRRNIAVKWVNNTNQVGKKEIRDIETTKKALYKTNCSGGNDYYLNIFKIKKHKENEFYKCIKDNLTYVSLQLNSNNINKLFYIGNKFKDYKILANLIISDFTDKKLPELIKRYINENKDRVTINWVSSNDLKEETHKYLDGLKNE